MTRQVNVGVIGTSWWADRMFLPSLASHPGAKLAAICGRDGGRAKEMAQKYRVERVFTNYKEMLASGTLEAVVVATPDDLHYRITMDALRAGLHVLCEKPLANTAAEARQMYETAEAHGLKHMILFTWRWMPHFQYMHDLIQDGYIGRCFDCRFDFVGDFGREFEYSWASDGRRCNGVVAGLGSHMIDMARWMVGDVTRVSASLRNFVERPGYGDLAPVPVNDSALLLVEFEGGAHGMIQTSRILNLGRRFMEQRVTLHGEEGSLEAVVFFDGPEAGAVIRGARHGEEGFQVLPVPDEYWGEVVRTDPGEAMIPGPFVTEPVGARLFVEAILDDGPLSPSFYDGYKAAAVVDAALASQETGRWVPL